MSFLDRLRGGGARPPKPVYITDLAMGHEPIARICHQVRLTGEFASASALLKQVGRNWDYRAIAVEALGGTAVTPAGAGWLESWRTAAPDDGDMLAVHAEAALQRAWRARGSASASETGQDAFAEFFRLLPDAESVALKATLARPDDPTPWVTLMRVTRGLQQPRSVFDTRWAELTERDPYNAHGTAQAMQYLCEKWSGSHTEMYAFARETAANAPSGSPLKLMLLEAHVEYVLREEWDSDEDHGELHWATHEARADLEDALREWPNGHGGDYPTYLRARSFLAYACAESERWSDFARQLTATGHRVWHEPWDYRSGSGYVEYAHMRAVKARAWT